MFQIRIHGRGGQGVVTAAELLSIAAFLDGQQAQAFPSFGSERMGAPVMAFCRISEKTIRLREPIMCPDLVVIQDPTLLHHVDLFSGLKPSAYVLLNSSRSLADLNIENYLSALPKNHSCTVDAFGIARKHLGRPLPNAALIGGVSALTGRIDISSIKKAIEQRFSGAIAEANQAAAEACYLSVQKQLS